ncbi:MAG TPA: PQQ-dependent sugar dehydrogenase [Povalibacter sp.]
MTNRRSFNGFLGAVALSSVAMLQGCGGGGGGGSANPPPAPPATPADTAAPTIPASVTATAASSSSINVSWDASTDTGGSNLSGYRLYRNGATTALATVNAPATTYADTGLTASTQYSYVVRAFDGAGNESSPSASISATTSAIPAMTSGLDTRPSNTTCVAWARPASGSIQVQPFTSLSFDASVALLQAPGDDTRWYVVEQDGTIKTFQGANATATTTYGSVTVTSGGEMGLLGMAFHPNFPTDSRVFLSYTRRISGGLVSRISSFANSSRTALGPTETVLLTLNQPQDNHNGGNIAFGKDGLLYIGFGDGGGGGDDHGSTGNGQLLTTMLGKMLRIDVGAQSATTYAIPGDNPFASNAKCTATTPNAASCPEIYAWGLRNPWRWSFDRSNGDLWAGDVGQGAWEEVNTVARGGNYGWRCREGAHEYSAGTPGCNTAASIDPVTEYDHSLGTAITGGYVYRGPQTTPLKGRYIFGDSGTGRLWAWIPENATTASPRKPTQLADTDLSIVSFGEGNDGELYVVNYNSLHKIVFQAPTGGGTVPTELSATGCVNSSDAKQPASGLIPYAVNAPFWSDGSEKNRWIGLPNGQNITVQSGGDWEFPPGTVLMKNFTVGTRLIETRLFMKHADDGSWGGYSYSWNDAQTDATLVRGGALRDLGTGQQWIYPSEAQCVQCHTNAAGGSLGLETAQLNRDMSYPQTGRVANELFTLNHIQTLTPAIPDPTAQPRLADPADTTASLNDRARAYLHTNCSQCHRPDGPTPSNMDLRYTTALAQTNACNATPQSGDLGLGGAARLIAPGSASNSIIVNRTNRRDANAMPPVGSNVVDAAGVQLLSQWINGLTGC